MIGPSQLPCVGRLRRARQLTPGGANVDLKTHRIRLMSHLLCKEALPGFDGKHEHVVGRRLPTPGENAHLLEEGLRVWQVDDTLNLNVDRGQASGSLNRYGVTD